MTRGTVFIDTERCKGCDLCTSVCPQGVLEIDHRHFNSKGYQPVLLVDPEAQCTGCGICAVMCPDVCITVYRYPRVPVHGSGVRL